MSITIYGKQGCVFCTKAKNTLDNLKIEYDYIDVGVNPEALEFILQEGHKSVPQVYIDGKCIGGYGQMMDYLCEGE